MRISDWSSDVCSSDLLARPGVALFGVDPGPNAQGLCPVVRLDARVLQIRTIEAGTGVGYGLDHIAPAPQRLATIALGYADGWPRCLGGGGAAWHRGARDRKSTRLNSSHSCASRMPSSA